jgi:hypothetical protein
MNIDKLKEQIRKCKTEEEYDKARYEFDRAVDKELYEDEQCRKAICEIFNITEEHLKALFMVDGTSYPDENEIEE